MLLYLFLIFMLAACTIMIWFDEDYWYGIDVDIIECSNYSELLGYEVDLDDPRILRLFQRYADDHGGL